MQILLHHIYLQVIHQRNNYRQDSLSTKHHFKKDELLNNNSKFQ